MPLVLGPALGTDLAFEGHLLALVISALDCHAANGAIVGDEAASPLRQKAGKRKLHVVEVGRLLEIGLVEGGHLLEPCARHIESAVHLDAREARLLRKRSLAEGGKPLEGGALEPGVAGEGGAFEPGVAGRRWRFANEAAPVKVALSNQASPVKVALLNGRRRRRWRFRTRRRR